MPLANMFENTAHHQIIAKLLIVVLVGFVVSLVEIDVVVIGVLRSDDSCHVSSLVRVDD